MRAVPSLASGPPPLYAATCRWRREADRPWLERWTHAFAVGQPLPTLPLWLADNLAMPLGLEASYEDTCRILRIDWALSVCLHSFIANDAPGLAPNQSIA